MRGARRASITRWMTAAALAREAAVEGGAAIRTRGFAFDPFRACLGFAESAAARGATLFERTPVRRIRAGRKAVEVTAGTGTVRAEAVIIATGAALPDLRALRRHLHPQQSYAVVTEPLPAAVRRELGRRAAALRDSASPPHFLRWLKDDRALFVGADQQPVAGPRARQDARPALRTADVRAVDDLPGDLRRHAGVVLGR